MTNYTYMTGTLITIGYDNVVPAKAPQKWNLPVLFTVGSVLAAVAGASSLLLLWAALDSWNPDGWFQAWGIPGKLNFSLVLLYPSHTLTICCRQGYPMAK